MTRPLAFTLEPSDALLGLLRLRATVDAARWPRDLTARLRDAVDRDFARIEPAVRTLGVCYLELEGHGVATLDRRRQSRFNDIDSAIHLAACAVEVCVDLDLVRLATSRGDDLVRERATTLAFTLRHTLWYAAHTDLLVCPRARIGGADATPERALDFAEQYFELAVDVSPPMPPREHAARESSPPPETLRGGDTLPRNERTDVFVPSRSVQDAIVSLGDAHRSFEVGDERTHPARTLSAETHAQLFAVAHETTHPSSETLERELSDDARYFLRISGTPWPCDDQRLRAARTALLVGTPVPNGASSDRESTRAWLDRIERGFRELRRRASQ
jgi:hypothetical protein